MAKETAKKIMIVDDDIFILDMYAQKFKNEGYEVETATNGEDCIDKIKRGVDPDVLLFDMVMPGIDGEQLVKALKDEELAEKAVKIILSNQGTQEDLDKVKEFGVSGYLIKAMTVPSEVVEKVGKIYSENKK